MPKLAVDDTGAPIQVAALQGSTTISIGPTSTLSPVFPQGITVVRIIPTVNCFVDFGANPTATPTSHYLIANSEYYFRVEPSYRVSFIQVDTNGTAYISYVV